MDTTTTISQKGVIPISEVIDLRDVLRLIGLKEVANNVFSLPDKKKKKGN